MNEQQALKALASIDAWLSNDEGLMTEDVIEWREQLADALGVPADSWFERSAPATPCDAVGQRTENPT